MKERQVVRTYVKRAAAKSEKNGHKYGMRYEAGFLIVSLLLKLKSPKAYRHLRERNILPLPSPGTLRRLLSSADVGCGFNELSLENNATVLKEFNDHPELRYGTLIWDEIFIHKDLTWDSKMLKWNRVVNFGSGIKEAAQQGLCDHVLMLVFRPGQLGTANSLVRHQRSCQLQDPRRDRNAGHHHASSRGGHCQGSRLRRACQQQVGSQQDRCEREERSQKLLSPSAGRYYTNLCIYRRPTFDKVHKKPSLQTQNRPGKSTLNKFEIKMSLNSFFASLQQRRFIICTSAKCTSKKSCAA